MSLRLNHRVKEIVGSTTLAITARAKELKSKGFDVVNFAGGEPDFDTPDFIKEAAVKAIKDGFTKYTPSTGTQELREAVARKFKADNNLTYSPNQIVVACGAKHAIYNIIQVLADEGDEVIFQSPYWVSYPEMVKLAGAKSVIIPTSAQNQFKMTAQQIAQHITGKTKILILNSPSNPTGIVYSKKELEEIAQVCVKNNIYVISDEIYEKLIYDIPNYTSIGSLGKEIFDLTITVNGVSKAYSMTGWRIGYCAGPQPEVMEYIKRFQDHSTSNPTSISQMAALAALNAKAESIEAMRREFQKRRSLMMAEFDKISEISYIKPQGAFYLYCDIARLGKSDDVAKRILDEVNVAFIPGDGFGTPGYGRMSFSTSAERIAEGVKRIAQWVSKNT